MLLLFQCLVCYSVTSLIYFIRDIYLKNRCVIEYTNEQIISDIKKAYPVVESNMMSVILYVGLLDIYYYIFGSTYSIIASMIQVLYGIPLSIALFICVSEYYNFDMDSSRREIMNKRDIIVKTPYMTLCVDNTHFNRVLRLYIFLTWMVLPSNEYVLGAYITVFFVLLCINTELSNTKLERYIYNNINIVFSRYILFVFTSINKFKSVKVHIYRYAIIPFSRCIGYFKGEQTNSVDSKDVDTIMVPLLNSRTTSHSLDIDETLTTDNDTDNDKATNENNTDTVNDTVHDSIIYTDSIDEMIHKVAENAIDNMINTVTKEHIQNIDLQDNIIDNRLMEDNRIELINENVTNNVDIDIK